jgi:mannitol-specific phosphotransferase system IIBC component
MMEMWLVGGYAVVSAAVVLGVLRWLRRMETVDDDGQLQQLTREVDHLRSTLLDSLATSRAQREAYESDLRDAKATLLKLENGVGSLEDGVGFLRRKVEAEQFDEWMRDGAFEH